MESELRKFHDHSGVTTLYITHDQREAMALADVMAVMNNGQMLQIGRPEEVYEYPINEQVAQFIGRGTLLEAEVNGNLAKINGQTLSVEGRGSGIHKMFIRPKHMELTDENDGSLAIIKETHYRGGHWEVSASLEGTKQGGRPRFATACIYWRCNPN